MPKFKKRIKTKTFINNIQVDTCSTCPNSSVNKWQVMMSGLKHLKTTLKIKHLFHYSLYSSISRYAYLMYTMTA